MKGGARGWRNAWANGGVPAFLALLAGAAGPRPGGEAAALLITVAYAAAVATAAADTCSSEVGKAYGRRTFLITTLRPVAPGTEGAVSLEGTAAGLGGGAIVGAVRLHVSPRFFLQAEYVALPGEGHTDHGPAVQVGISSRNGGLRPYAAIGGGPVRGLSGDDGLIYGALGISHSIGGRRRLFLQPEVRIGMLGESGYTQIALGVGFAK